MQHASFFVEIVNRRHLIEGLMNSFGKAGDYMLCEMVVEKGVIMDYIEMIVDELIPDRSFLSHKFNTAH